MTLSFRLRKVLVLLALPVVGSGAAAGVTVSTHAPIDTCRDGALPPDVDALVKPVLLASVAAQRQGRFPDQAFERELYQLLETQGTVALEAKVAMMSYYIGEHYGEELLEAALQDAMQSDALVARYEKCRPHVSFESELDGVVVLRTLYDIYLEERRR